MWGMQAGEREEGEAEYLASNAVQWQTYDHFQDTHTVEHARASANPYQKLQQVLLPVSPYKQLPVYRHKHILKHTLSWNVCAHTNSNTRVACLHPCSVCSKWILVPCTYLRIVGCCFPVPPLFPPYFLMWFWQL